MSPTSRRPTVATTQEPVSQVAAARQRKSWPMGRGVGRRWLRLRFTTAMGRAARKRGNFCGNSPVSVLCIQGVPCTVVLALRRPRLEREQSGLLICNFRIHPLMSDRHKLTGEPE